MGFVATNKEAHMRRGLWIGVALLAVAAGILIGVGSYHAGVNHGIEQAGDAGRIVRVYGWGGGGFPFGFLLFPLVIFGIIAIASGARRRRWAAMGGGPGWGGQGWGGHGPGSGNFGPPPDA